MTFSKFIPRKHGLLRAMAVGEIRVLVAEVDEIRHALKLRLKTYPDEEYSWDQKAKAVRRDK